VGVVGVDTRSLEGRELPAVVEEIHRVALQMTALHEHVARPKGVNPPRRFFHLGAIGHGHPRQHLRLGKIGRHGKGEGQEARDEHAHGLGLEERCAGLGHHDRIHHELLDPAGGQRRGHGVDDGGIGEHAALGGVGAEILEDGFDLARHEGR
jgi:hypothetical protein